MRPIRVLPIVALLLSVVVGAQAAYAVTPKAADLVVPVTALGVNWTVLGESTEGSSALFDVYLVNYTNEVSYGTRRAATFSATVAGTEALAEQLIVATKAPFETQGITFTEASGLGDGSAWEGTLPESSGAVGTIYIFRAGTVMLVTQVVGEPGDDEAAIGQQAVAYALFQLERVRSAIGVPPPLTPEPAG